MTRSHNKADYENVLTKIFKAEVDDPIDLIIRPTWTGCGIHDLISDPKSFLQETSTVKGDEVTTLKHYGVVLIRTHSLCIFYHLDNEVASSFSWTSISPEYFDNFRLIAKCRKLGQKHGDYGEAPGFHKTNLGLTCQHLGL